jgi:hypothetical protein
MLILLLLLFKLILCLEFVELLCTDTAWYH